MAAGEETDWEARAFDLEEQVNDLREQLRLASAAAPHIESALLDRIEKKVWGLRMQTEYLSGASIGAEAQQATLNAVSAILTEIREEGK